MDVGNNGVRPLFAACIRISKNGEEPLFSACMACIRISAEQANKHDKAKRGQRSAPFKREITILDSAEKAPCQAILDRCLLFSVKCSNTRCGASSVARGCPECVIRNRASAEKESVGSSLQIIAFLWHGLHSHCRFSRRKSLPKDIAMTVSAQRLYSKLLKLAEYEELSYVHEGFM
jgi:hypothetical protein